MEWSKYRRLAFNIDKCKIMRIQQCCNDEFKLNGNKLQEVTEEKDLGIIVTKDLFKALKAMQVLGIIKRNFVLTDAEDFRLLFNRFVRPHLKYCVSVWSPYLRKDVDCLEKVQRIAKLPSWLAVLKINQMKSD